MNFKPTQTFDVLLTYKSGNQVRLKGLISFKVNNDGATWKGGGPDNIMFINTAALEAMFEHKNGFLTNLYYAIWRKIS